MVKLHKNVIVTAIIIVIIIIVFVSCMYVFLYPQLDYKLLEGKCWIILYFWIPPWLLVCNKDLNKARWMHK